MKTSFKFDHYKFEKADVSGGIPVFVKKIPWISDWLELRIGLKVGARNDPIGKEGMAHFMEHMPFKGCKDFPDFEAIKKSEEDLFFDHFNANTSIERICFSGKVLRRRLPEALRFLKKFIFFPNLDAGEIKKERLVIIREIWDRVHNQKIVDFFKKIVPCLNAGNHPLGRMAFPCGWEDSVKLISRKDLIDFHQIHYNASNIFVVMAGDIEMGEALKETEKFAKDLPAGTKASLPAPTYEVWPAPKINSLKTSYSEMGLQPTKYATLEIDRLISGTKSQFELDIFGDVLHEVLTRKIREDLGAMYGMNFKKSLYADLIHTRILLNATTKNIPKVKKIIFQTLDDLKSGKLRETFESEKNKIIVGKKILDHTASMIAENAADDIAFFGEPISLQEETERTKKITYDDIIRLVETNFTCEKLLVLEIYP